MSQAHLVCRNFELRMRTFESRMRLGKEDSLHRLIDKVALSTHAFQLLPLFFSTKTAFKRLRPLKMVNYYICY